MRGDARDWVARYEPALKLALDEFLTSAEWPERERFRRRIVQRELDHLSLDELIHEMPKSWWESRHFPPDKIVLPLQVLQQMPNAQPLLAVCMAMTQRAYELYRAEDQDEPVLHSDDPALLAAAGGDEHLLLCAREVHGQHPPSPLAGGTSGTGTSQWTRWLNEATAPGFKGVASIEDYLAAQERIISAHPYRRPALPANSLADGTAPEMPPQDTDTAPRRIELFVIMPFSEPWSATTYAFLRRVVERLDAPGGTLHLYRADDIAEPGQITQQVKDSIARAQATIADITSNNPNVMWELGYADGLGRTIVILNQDPASSPFDMVDRRQVTYQADPTADDEASLLRHIIEALRTADGIPIQASTVTK